MYYKTRSYRIFSVANYIILAVLSLLCILPLVHTIAVSFSGKAPAMANLVGLWPIDFTFAAYNKTFENDHFVSSLWIGVIRTVLGTIVGMFLVFLTAYPLSKDDIVFQGRSIYAWYFIFTMLFSGGLIPLYLTVLWTGIMNTIWALILPGAVNVWLVVLMLNYFRNVPRELEEASLIDGAGQFRTMINIYLPISMPAIATLSLFTMVGHWNSWFDGLLYISNAEDYPLATFLQTVIVQQNLAQLDITRDDVENISSRTVRSAQIILGALPILLVYPFLQRFFVKGIVLGSVKE